MSEPTRDRGEPLGHRGPYEQDDPKRGMSLVVKTVTRLLAGFILLYGVYVVIYGHLSPGGGFAGGVALACGLILVVLAFGRRFMDQFISQRGAGFWDSAGALAFLAIAVLGYLAGRFFQNFLRGEQGGEPFQLFSGGTIPLSNIAIGIKVSACLFVVFVVLAAFRLGQGDEGASAPFDSAQGGLSNRLSRRPESLGGEGPEEAPAGETEAGRATDMRS